MRYETPSSDRTLTAPRRALRATEPLHGALSRDGSADGRANQEKEDGLSRMVRALARQAARQFLAKSSDVPLSVITSVQAADGLGEHA